MNEIIAAVAAASEALLFDFSSTFPPDCECHGDGYYSNEARAGLEVRLFAAFSIQQGLVPEA